MQITLGRIRINTRGCGKRQFRVLDLDKGLVLNLYGILVVVDKRSRTEREARPL